MNQTSCYLADEEMPNENEDGIDENIQDEADHSQDQTMEDEESKEVDKNEGKEDTEEEIIDQEKLGEEPQVKLLSFNSLVCQILNNACM